MPMTECVPARAFDATSTEGTIEGTSISVFGRGPKFTDGTFVQMGMCEAGTFLSRAEIDGEYKVATSWVALAGINVTVAAAVEGNLVLAKGTREGAIGGHLELAIKASVPGLEIEPHGTGGFAQKHIFVTAAQEHPLKIVLGEQANTTEMFYLDVNGGEAGQHDFRSGNPMGSAVNSLKITDKLEDGVRLITIG